MYTVALCKISSALCTLSADSHKFSKFTYPSFHISGIVHPKPKMVNLQALKDQLSKAPPNMPNGGDIFKHIFEQAPDLRKFWDMEDFEPEQAAKSRSMQQRGASMLSSFHHLVNNVDNERPFRQEMAEIRDTFKELGITLADAKKLQAGVSKFFAAKAGKEESKAWGEFFEKFVAGLKEVGLN